MAETRMICMTTVHLSSAQTQLDIYNNKTLPLKDADPPYG